MSAAIRRRSPPRRCAARARKLVNRAGERFMVGVHPSAELAPRDVVARAVHAEIAAGRGAFLDCREALGAEFAEKFPTVYKSCREAGIDPATELIPIAPAEHFHMGGVLTDADGRSSLDGLWACGETVVDRRAWRQPARLEFAARGRRLRRARRGFDPRPLSAAGGEGRQPRSSGDAPAAVAADAIRTLRRTMSDHVGVVRDRAGLERALGASSTRWRQAATAPSFLNMLATARLIAAAALKRTESRGAHMRSDFPEHDEAWRHRTYMTLAEAVAASPRARHRLSEAGHGL